jgi:hypothetical protein
VAGCCEYGNEPSGCIKHAEFFDQMKKLLRKGSDSCGWLVNWLVGWLVGWLVACLLGLVGWLVGWLINWLVA